MSASKRTASVFLISGIPKVSRIKSPWTLISLAVGSTPVRETGPLRPPQVFVNNPAARRKAAGAKR